MTPVQMGAVHSREDLLPLLPMLRGRHMPLHEQQVNLVDRPGVQHTLQDLKLCTSQSIFSVTC